MEELTNLIGASKAGIVQEHLSLHPQTEKDTQAQ
jgi:hypothetical protein